jgi:hypothetical protein
MSVSTYYLSKTKEGKFGSVFFLKQLQDVDSSGGGKNLLGSMVQWIDDNGPMGIGLGGTDYAIPQCMSTPRALIKELDRRSVELGIDGSSTLQIKVSASKETIKLEKKALFDLGVGPFPLIPLNIALDIDYSRMKTITLLFGEGTFSEYIPTGFLAALYEVLKGKPTPAMGGKLLEKNAYISQVVLAKRYSIKFESSMAFSSGVDAKIKQYNSLPEIGRKVKVQKETERSMLAEVNSDKFYVVAITASLWKNLK